MYLILKDKCILQFRRIAPLYNSSSLFGRLVGIKLLKCIGVSWSCKNTKVSLRPCRSSGY